MLYFLLVRLRIARWWPAAIMLLAALSAVAGTDPRLRDLPAGSYLFSGLLQYLPVFGIGMVMALNEADLRRCAARLLGTTARRTAVVTLLAGVLLVSPSYVPANLITRLLSLFGVVLVVLLALASQHWGKVLGRRPWQWTGGRSFSIYLIHEPVIVAMALLTRAAGPWPWLAVAALTGALVLPLADGFYRLVERPAHRLSARIGRPGPAARIAARAERQPAERPG